MGRPQEVALLSRLCLPDILAATFKLEKRGTGQDVRPFFIPLLLFTFAREEKATFEVRKGKKGFVLVFMTAKFRDVVQISGPCANAVFVDPHLNR